MWIVALVVASVALWEIEDLKERVRELERQLDNEPE